MVIGNNKINLNHDVVVMGILNVTPDSFSDGGHYIDMDKAKKHVEKMINEGATIIDVGGESTRPGHNPVNSEEEIKRVIPAIRMIKENYDVIVSIDTSKAQVAEEAIKAGADMVNDVWGLRKDPEMATVIAKYDVPCCIMHNKEDTNYEHLIMDMVRSLGESVKIAMEAGVRREQIMIDPGVGFGKTVEQNLEIMRQLSVFTGLGYPVLLGTSRKSMIGKTLDLPVNERVEGTIATTVIGLMAGVKIFRVHDVKENKRAIDMTKAIYKIGETNE